MSQHLVAKFALGHIVRHRDAAFRGVVIDIDGGYDGPPAETGSFAPDQPYYRVLAMGPDGGFIAYAAETVLEPDPEQAVLTSEVQRRWFTIDSRGRHAPVAHAIH
ncbi:MAG TPA: heat shock protein HspQ [Brevundimonas sp.]|jgi:heat shock protein HspQ|uniref:heat shock protein HspQ n=1 Tax=Brevundimonas sp. TaxID=1871086 RepID=UPI002ED7D43E